MATTPLPVAAPDSRPLSYDQWCAVLSGERLPAVVVDLAAFDANVRAVASILRSAGGGHTLRLATKSVRVPALIRRVLDSDPVYQGLMCFSVEEAAFLASQGFDDFLVAYPTVQAADLQAARQVHLSGKRICLMVDSLEQIEMISAALADLAEPLPLAIDIDMSLRPFNGRLHLGVRRSPVRSAAQVLALYEAAERLPGVRIVGMMGYEAQVAGLGDRNPFKRKLNGVAGLIRRRSLRMITELREELASAVRERGYPLEIFNGGGTGSVTFATAEPWLTELTAGSGFVCSHLFDYFSNIRLQPACFFALQVVRSSDAGFVTCLGGGYIASGEPGWDKQPLPYLPQGVKLVSTEGCGEVQTPLQVGHGAPPRLGQPVLFRHAKAGELAERFNEYLLVSAGKIQDRVPTYRGAGQCFF